MTRDVYTIDCNYLIHTHDDLLTGERVSHRYYIPLSGGYVRVDTTRDFSRPGTLGDQPTHSDGSTWRASTVIALKRLVVAARRRERRIYTAY